MEKDTKWKTFKDSKLHPVITFVLYSGESWDGARSLHEILDFTDVKQVFDFIRLSGDKEALLKLVENDDSYRHMDEDAFEVITTYTYSKELRKQIEKMQQESKKGDDIEAIMELTELTEEEIREIEKNMLVPQ